MTYQGTKTPFSSKVMYDFGYIAMQAGESVRKYKIKELATDLMKNPECSRSSPIFM
jgi:hypothetical protein